MRLIENMQWRYATKKMDAAKVVSDKDIEQIKEVIRLAASSYGLQPYKIIDVKDAELRKKLKPVCWNQPQITDASHLFIFCHQVRVEDRDVDNYLKLISETRGVSINDIAGYGDFMKSKLKEKSHDEMFNWTARQAYIALSNGLSACADLKIDSTPMEGFDVEAVNDLLGLADHGLSACVLMAIGYRDEADTTQHAPKVRKSVSDLFMQL